MFDWLKELIRQDEQADSGSGPSAQDFLSGSGEHRPGAMDYAQFAGDFVGFFDPTGIVDGVNSAVSLSRAVVDKKQRARHLKDASIRAISTIPFIGDFAKVARSTRYEKEAQAAMKSLKNRPGQPNAKPSVSGAVSGFFQNYMNSGRKQDDGDQSDNPDQPMHPEVPNLDEFIARRSEEDPKAKYFFGSKDDRKNMRLDIRSEFYNADEAWDEKLFRTGLDNEKTRQRRDRRDAEEDLHQEFLRDPNMDVSKEPQSVKKAKESFDAEYKQQTQDRMKEESSKVLDLMKQSVMGFKGLVTALALLPAALKRFGEALVEWVRPTGVYDGPTSAKLNELDVQKIKLDQQYAQATSGSAQAFLEEMRLAREAHQPLREWGGVGMNTLGTALMRIQRGLSNVQVGALNVAGNIAGIKQIVEWFQNNEKGKKFDDSTRGQVFAQFLGKDNPKNPFHQGNRGSLPPLK